MSNNYFVIPTLEIDSNKIVSKSKFKIKTILFDEIVGVELLSLNKIYRIGTFFRLISDKGEYIDVPIKFYKNESDVFTLIESEINKRKPNRFSLKYRN